MITIHEAAEAYIAHLRACGRKESYVSNVGYHLAPFRAAFGSFAVDAILPADIDAVVAKRLETCSAAYVAHSLTVARALARWIFRTHSIDCQWHKSLTPPRVERKLPTVLTKEEQLTVLGCAQGGPARLAIEIALKSGLRHQEIMHLQRHDYDPYRRALRVVGKPAVGWTPKTHEERVVPIPRSLAESLIMTSDASWWLFPHGDKTVPMPDLYEPVAATFRLAGITEDRRPGLHMCRRTWATAMLRNGTPLPDLMRMGGWNKLATVQKYLGTDMEAWRGYAAKLDD